MDNQTIEIINQISATSSRNDKERILKENKDNVDLKNILEFVYNPFILTGISKKKINKEIVMVSLMPFSDNLTSNNYMELFEYLKKNNTGKDKDIIVAQDFIKNRPQEYQEFWTQIICKDLKIGITEKTLNKIYGEGFIPSFGCMLAEKYFDNMSKVVSKEFTLTTKRDGNRCIFTKENGVITAFTRQGLVYDGLVDLENELASLPIDNIAIDGELMVINDKEIPSDIQFKETMKIVRKDGIKTGIKLVVFDYILLADFKKGISIMPYSERRETLEDIFKNCKYFEPVEKIYTGDDIEQIELWLNTVTEQGDEGIMINLNDAPYQCKRTKDLLKVKKFQSADLKIIGIQEGDGKYKNNTGAIIVDYKGNPVGVGTGLDDTTREYMWKNQDAVIGRVVEIKYFEECTNQKDDNISLRFPVFKCIREIGKEVSYN